MLTNPVGVCWGGTFSTLPHNKHLWSYPVLCSLAFLPSGYATPPVCDTLPREYSVEHLPCDGTFILGVWRELVTYVLLYVPKSRLVAVTMFEYWQGGWVEVAATVGLVTIVAAIPLAFIAQKMSVLADGTAAAT